MAKNKTIVVEDRLRENFKYLPEMAGNNNDLFPVIFKGGDEKELLAFFIQNARNSNYPLIWLDMPYEENHLSKRKVELTGLTLVLAVETNAVMLNSERLETTYKPTLYPLLDNILDVFRVSNTISFDGKFKITKFPNYGEEEENEEKGKTVDIWDAIKLTLNLTINDNCLREIKI